MALAPDGFNRRSFVYRELVGLGADFAEVNGAACAMTCGAAVDDEIARARELALCDLSPLPRTGFKGRETVAWLAAQGAIVSDLDNMTVREDEASRIARLAPGEVLVLDDLSGAGALCARLAAAWSPEPDPGTYPVPRAETSCWFALSGARAAETLAKVCGVDVRAHKFPEGAIAQTSLARLSAIVIRGDLGATLAYDVLTDSAAASYMWESLLDAMAEFDGRPVGLAAVRALAGAA